MKFHSLIFLTLKLTMFIFREIYIVIDIETRESMFDIFEIEVLLCSSGWPRNYCIAQIGLKFDFLLQQPPQCDQHI